MHFAWEKYSATDLYYFDGSASLIIFNDNMYPGKHRDFISVFPWDTSKS